MIVACVIIWSALFVVSHGQSPQSTGEQTSSDQGINVIITPVTSGSDDQTPKENDYVTLYYTTMLTDAYVLDSAHFRSEPLTVQMGASEIIPGLEAALYQLRKDQTAMVFVPSDAAYGPDGLQDKNQIIVPPNTDLIFLVKILDIQSGSMGPDHPPKIVPLTQ